MRPTRLELEGFSSFREQTVVDFDGADYFVLMGQTGAGKSTIIDAICFALYGSVPRLEHKGKVAPVITQGQLEAKVRLDFDVDGRSYTAVRVVKRTAKDRATTKEARLESGDETMAGTADEVTEQVTDLIGLSFDHFTKCVVLPQGEFSRFLHDEPSKRQDMLVSLLNLKIYERMRYEANSRASAEKTNIGVMERRLEEDLSFATDQALKEAQARLEALDALRAEVSAAMPKLEELHSGVLEAERQESELQSRIKHLRSLRMPDAMEELGDRLSHAQKALSEADDIVAQATEKVSAATKAHAALPAKDPLTLAAAAHARKAELAAKLSVEERSLQAAGKEEKAARETAAQTTVDLEQARSAEQSAKDQHAALHLAGSLKRGEPCPVCLHPVKTLPKHPKATALAKAKAEVEKAESAAQKAALVLQKTADKRLSATTGADLLKEQLGKIEQELSQHPDAGAVKDQLARIAEADKALAAARDAEAKARDAQAQERRAVGDLKAAETKQRMHFDATRDAVVTLTPPSAAREDLVADWEELIEWAAGKIPSLQKEESGIQKRIRDLSAERDGLLSALATSCAQCEVDVEGGDILAPTVAAQTEAKQDVKRIEKAIHDSGKLRVELKEASLRHEVSGKLAHHLSASGFEKWIVNEALKMLVASATEILRELSGEQYSLTIDERGNFLVTDHYNADETRSAKTLSGGETFLASLSLSLALSDRLMDLAAEGSAKLEAIFLDEGFGTLDPETLDTVAATVENLAAKGRMVGIITHVRELADRVPLQYRVTKDLRTSRLERIAS